MAKETTVEDVERLVEQVEQDLGRPLTEAETESLLEQILDPLTPEEEDAPAGYGVVVPYIPDGLPILLPNQPPSAPGSSDQ